MALTLKQRKFVDAYLGVSNGNATDAARRAGYAGNRRTLAVVGWETLRRVEVQKAIKIVHIKVNKDVHEQHPWVLYVAREPYGTVKIGITKYLEQRMSSLATACPYDIEVLFTVEVADARWAERQIHERFAHKRVKGEWFRLDEDEIESLRMPTFADFPLPL